MENEFNILHSYNTKLIFFNKGDNSHNLKISTRQSKRRFFIEHFVILST